MSNSFKSKMSGVKKRVSKKSKSSWRKYVNIQDVEDFLEEKRQEERIGSVSEKKDDELFTVDTKSNDKLLTAKQKRKLNALKPPRNLLPLQNTSKVQDPLVQRDHVKLKKNGRNLFEELLNPKKSNRVQQSIADRTKYYEKLEKITNRDKTGKIFKDAWAEDEDLDRKQFLNNDWISRNLALHNLSSIGKSIVKVHDSAHHKTTRAKSFEIPHPGISYNPSLKDHQDLIKKVIEKEEKIIKEEKHLKRVTTDMFTKVTAEQRDSAWFVEMSSGVLSSPVGEQPGNTEEDKSDSDSGIAYDTVNPPVENKKKPKKAKRKKQEQREILQKIQKKKELKKKTTDIHRLKHLTTEVLEEKAAELEAKKRRFALKEKKKFEPKRLSKLKYQEPEIVVAMAEDIGGSLRSVKPGTSLLVDRFKNFQKRNILPMSIDLGTNKRSKVKRYVRNTHKEKQLPLPKKQGVKKTVLGKQ